MVRQVWVLRSQNVPDLQQVVQPHRVEPDPQRLTHCPLTSCCPQGQEVGGGVSHTPPWQNSPPGQVPLVQVPPQPLGAPQALPEQLGWHLQLP
jgi:hypothetical protein